MYILHMYVCIYAYIHQSGWPVLRDLGNPKVLGSNLDYPNNAEHLTRKLQVSIYKSLVMHDTYVAHTCGISLMYVALHFS